MNRHVTIISAGKPTKSFIGQKTPVRQAKGGLLSLALLACSALLPAQAAEVGQARVANIAGYEGSGSSTPTPQPTTWVGVAVSTNGRVFFQSNGEPEKTTRYAVQSECENTAGRTCQAIAVPLGWEVVALSCQGHGRIGGFVGGSGIGNASGVATDRAGQAGFDADGECTEVYRRRQ